MECSAGSPIHDVVFGATSVRYWKVHGCEHEQDIGEKVTAHGKFIFLNLLFILNPRRTQMSG